MKEKWFEYIVNNKPLWVHGFTLKRLRRVEEDVLNDGDIMFDLLSRHNGAHQTPEEMKESDIITYHHAIGNFICSILYKMIEKKLIK